MEKVFRAHTDPELVVQWLGPRDLVMEIDHWDCRTGGAYRYVHVRGDDHYWFHGSFHEVRPSGLIVQTFTFEGEPDGVALEKMVLEDLGDVVVHTWDLARATGQDERLDPELVHRQLVGLEALDPGMLEASGHDGPARPGRRNPVAGCCIVTATSYNRTHVRSR